MCYNNEINYKYLLLNELLYNLKNNIYWSLAYTFSDGVLYINLRLRYYITLSQVLLPRMLHELF